MKLRTLHLTTTTTRTVNQGSKKYPKPVVETEVTEKDILQFSEDDGKTWQDVPVEYEFMEAIYGG